MSQSEPEQVPPVVCVPLKLYVPPSSLPVVPPPALPNAPAFTDVDPLIAPPPPPAAIIKIFPLTVIALEAVCSDENIEI